MGWLRNARAEGRARVPWRGATGLAGLRRGESQPPRFRHPGMSGQRPSGRLALIRVATLIHDLHMSLIGLLTMTGACVHAHTPFPDRAAPCAAPGAVPREVAQATPIGA